MATTGEGGGARRHCEGLVRLRQRAVFADEGADESSSDGRPSAADRLCDGVWYFCVAQAPPATVEWFTLDGEVSDDEDGGAGGRVLLATTMVSGFEAVDGESVKLPEDELLDEQPVAVEVDDTDRRDLEQRCFYLEDLDSECAFLCEVEAAGERELWRNILGRAADPLSDAVDGHGGDETHEEAESATGSPETTPSDPDSTALDGEPRSEGRPSGLPLGNHSDRALQRLNTSNLDEDDAFGLLSMTTSALSSLTASATSSAALISAPGLFAFERIEIQDADEKASDTESDRVSVSDDGCSVEAVEESVLTASSRGASMSQPSLNYSSSTPMTSQPVVHSNDACFRCQKRIGRLFHRAKTCYSCDHNYCRDHCSAYCHISSFPKESKKAVKQGKSVCLVCIDCMVRQELLSTVSRGISYFKEIADAGGLAKLGRWRFFDQQPKLELASHIQANRLGPLSLLSAMYKYRRQPFMFIVALAQLVKNVELCIDTLDFYWPQFLQWGFVHLADAADSVRTFYLFFLAATCRRSVHLALKAAWECIAAHWDAMVTGAFDRGNFIVRMLFFVTQVSFGEPRSVLHQLLFMTAPEHQRDHLEELLSDLYEATRTVYAVSLPESPFIMWLTARCDEEIQLSSRAVRQYMDTHGGFLDPFPDDYFEEQQRVIVERRMSGTRHVMDSRQMITSAPALHIFSDAIQLVRFLVDLATYLKECTPEPSERKLRLPGLLEEMLHGKHIRPEAYLPFVSITHPLHRVVNVLTDEGTVFSTKARAPTLVFFEVISSNLQDAALNGCSRPSGSIAKRQRHGSHQSDGNGSPTESEDDLDDDKFGTQLDVLNYLDGNIVETYVADLIPLSYSESASYDTLAQDLHNLSISLPADCVPPRPSSVNGSFHSEQNGVGPADDSGDPCGDACAEDEQERSGRSLSASLSSGGRCKFFGERFEAMRERVRAQSKFADYDGWDLLPVIAKSFDDMRQEVFVLQGVRLFQLIFSKHNLDLWMHYYSIMCAGKDCGLLEVIVNAQSLDALKKKAGHSTALRDIFDRACGKDPATGLHDPERLEVARQNFISSMAAYSLFSYVFLVKDRHNGNIMLDTEGHMIHIDFGFVLGIAPGNSLSIETAPFKLTAEMVDVMGTAGFDLYKQMVTQGLVALHLEAKQILSLVYLSSKDSCFPCFVHKSRSRIIRRLKRRLCVDWSLPDVERTAAQLIAKSYNHLGTRQYDKFQHYSNGIMA